MPRRPPRQRGLRRCIRSRRCNDDDYLSAELGPAAGGRAGAARGTCSASLGSRRIARAQANRVSELPSGRVSGNVGSIFLFFTARVLAFALTEFFLPSPALSWGEEDISLAILGLGIAPLT